MKDYSVFADALRRMVSNTHTRSDIELVASTFAKYSRVYLQYQVSCGRIYFDTALLGNQPIDDIAIDSVAELFSRDDKNQFNQLQRSFLEIRHMDDIDVVGRVRQVVSSAAKQNVFSVFKQVDPAGWRIYRNLSDVKDRRMNVRAFGLPLV